MKKLAIIVGMVAVVVLALTAVTMAAYGAYQGSQLYPAVHQQLGYQACLNDVNAKIAEQQKQQETNSQINEAK